MLILFISTHVACKKDTGSITLDPDAANTGMIALDTFTIVTRTVKEDSVITNPTTYQLLGAINSSTFGLSSSSVICNFSLPSAGFSFPTNFTLDSVVLQLAYIPSAQYNGNLSQALTYNIQELSEFIYADTPYYSNRVFSYQSGIEQFSKSHNVQDSIDVLENGIQRKYAPHLRVNLNGSIRSRMENITQANLGSVANFQNYLNGIRIQPQVAGLAQNSGHLVYLDLRNAVSGLMVYYNDTMKALFPTNGSTVRMNLFDHDFSNAPQILEQLNNPNQDFDVTYLQSMAGLKTRVEIPGLLNLVNDDAYSVLNARFEFHFDESSTNDDFKPFSRLLLLKRNEQNRNDFVRDFFDGSFYDGNLNSNQAYRFNLNREIQDILNNWRVNRLNKNTGFFLIVPIDNPVSGSRLQLDTRKRNARGVKFVVTVVKAK